MKDNVSLFPLQSIQIITISLPNSALNQSCYNKVLRNVGGSIIEADLLQHRDIGNRPRHQPQSRHLQLIYITEEKRAGGATAALDNAPSITIIGKPSKAVTLALDVRVVSRPGYSN